MLLTDAQIAIVSEQTGLSSIPADHKFSEVLEARYGAHTFYLGDGGLYVAEPFLIEAEQMKPVVFVKIAVWADDNRSSLANIKPERTEHAVDLMAAT